MNLSSILLMVLIAGVAVWGALQIGGGEESNGRIDTYENAIEDAENIVDDIEERNIVSDERSVADASIELSNQDLSKAPEYIFDRTDTTELNLSGNHISGALQAEVRHLEKLRVLDLSDNNFNGIPAEVGQLQALEVLNLSNNPITGLPHEIGNLKNLKVLDLRGTNYAKQDLAVIKQTLSTDVEIQTD